MSKILNYFGHKLEYASGPSCPSYGYLKECREKGIPVISTCDIRTWICLDGKDWKIVRNSTDLLYLELADTEEEFLKFISSIYD